MHVERLGLARSEEVVGEEARTFERPGRQLALF
jgi:hypothetical protein